MILNNCNYIIWLQFTDQLKAKQEVQAEYYDIVTIFFSDIVGFTQMSAKCSPHDIVILLDRSDDQECSENNIQTKWEQRIG